MVGNWTEWKVTHWNGKAYVFERVRAYRSWFGFLREEREWKSFPGLDEECGLALLNGESLMPTKRHYEGIDKLRQERNAAKAELRSCVEGSMALAASNAGLKARADHFERKNRDLQAALVAEQSAYDELLAAVAATRTDRKRAPTQRGRRDARKR